MEGVGCGILIDKVLAKFLKSVFNLSSERFLVFNLELYCYLLIVRSQSIM